MKRPVGILGSMLFHRVRVLLFLSAMPALAAPNLVVILLDDLGYGDVGAYNPDSRIPTPNMDHVAALGLRFTDAHSPDGVCTPTRYGLLTGRYAWRTWLKSGVLTGSSPPLIKADRLTLADLLRNKGYTTAMVGKWHLGRRWSWIDPSGKQVPENIDWAKPVIDGPMEHGFTYSFGLARPAWAFVENGYVLARPLIGFDLTHLPVYLMGGNNNKGIKSPGFEFERMLPRFTEEAVGFITRAAGEGRPWFLYFAPLAPHRPVVPNQDFHDRSAAGLYGDFVAEVDWAVGEVVSAIERAGATQDTLLIVTSDNGPETDAYRRMLEYRHTSMGALRGLKRDLWEGGHRVPFLASWPGTIPANTVEDEVLCLTDLMATVAAMVDYPLPPDSAEDSYDMSDVLLRKPFNSPIREATVHHGSRGWFGIRQGDWVLIDHPTGDSNTGRNGEEPNWFRTERSVVSHDQNVELFNLRQDPGQTVNRAGDEPLRVSEMRTLLERYRRDGRSIPER